MTIEGNVIYSAQSLSKRFGHVHSLRGVNFSLKTGEIHCLLGDNGAGKSTLIKILSGAQQPTCGTLELLGQRIQFNTPKQALDAGIATVYQDLAILPMMSIERNFFLGREITRGVWPVKYFDFAKAGKIVSEKLQDMGIRIRSPKQMAGTLSGGERQSLAIARAIYFGAKILILDEPTSALGVTQTARVLNTMLQAKRQGVSVIFITHNVRHAFAIGDRFTILRQGQSQGTYKKSELSTLELQDMMSNDQFTESLENLALETV